MTHAISFFRFPNVGVARARTVTGRLLAATSLVLLTTACGVGGNGSGACINCGSTSSDGDPYPALQAIDRSKMQAAVAARAAEMLVPGAVVLVRTPNGDFTSYYGTTTYKGSTPTRADQHLRVGSVTKTWTGTVILQQIQDGKLQLTDPIGKYIAGVPKGDQITIEMLLLMRSGLLNYTTSIEFDQELDDNPKRVWTPSEALALVLNQPEQSFDPGSRYEYCNTNTLLLGLVAQKLENGKPLAEIMHDRLFKPLGLMNTLLPKSSVNTLPAPFSRGYHYGTNVQTRASLPPELQAAARAGTFTPTDQTEDNPSWGWAAGAGISTANDLVTFVRALVGGGLLNEKMQAARLASVRDIGSGSDTAGYGWNLARFGPLYGHTGELPGYNTFMGYDPTNKVTLVVWTNLGPRMDGGAAATDIARTLIGQIYAKRS